MEIIIKLLIFLLMILYLFKIESILILQYYDNKRLSKNLYQIYKSKYGIISLFIFLLLISISIFSNCYLSFFLSFFFLLIHYFYFSSPKFKFTRRSISVFIASIFFSLYIFTLPFKLLKYILLFIPILSFITLIISNKIEYIFEIIIRKKYIKAAKNKLNKNQNRIIIAITGSYGKTSLKYYLTQVLSYKYKVKATKGSVNTLMGLTKFINNEVEDYDEIIILEAGVDSIKGMDKLLTLFTPDIGILTSIGSMHLATFKNKDNIFNEKLKLLSSSKIGYFCLDNDYLSSKKEILTKYNAYSMNQYFSSFKRNKDGLLVTYKDKQIQIPLYGLFTLSSLSLVIKIAFLLNYNEEEIIKILPNLKGEKHRLEKKVINNMIIIDDAYNGNYDGIKEGIQTILCFEGKKAIITPGVIELGHDYYNINYQLGKELTNLDFVIIVSSSLNHPLLDGYKDNHGDKDKIIVVSNFAKGYELTKKRNINVLLIANDTFKTFLK